MKKFNNLFQAIHYFDKCPSCHQKLSISNRSAWIEHHHNKITIKFRLLHNDILSLEIKQDSTNVEINIKQSLSDLGYLNYGINYQSLHINCDNPNCGMFSFALQLKIDISKKYIEEISLYSESLSYEDQNSVLWEIENNYYQNNTKLSHHLSDKTKSYQIPLLSINYENIPDTFDKVKNLINFI